MGYTAEATAFRDWLLRAVAGDPAGLHIMYGNFGERRLPELELPWLAATRILERDFSTTVATFLMPPY